MGKSMLSIVKKELLYMFRSPKAILFEFFLPLVNFLPIIFTVWYAENRNGTAIVSQALGTTYINNYYIVVLLSFVFFNMAETPGNLLETELYLGTFEQILATPTNAFAMIRGWYLFSLIKTTLYISIFVVFSLLFAETSVINIPLVLFLLIALLIQAYGFGVIIQAITMYMRQADSIVSTLIGLIPILSCITYPLNILPQWVRSISMILPTTYLFDLLKYAFSGSKLLLPIKSEIILLVIVSFGFIIFCMIFYRILLRKVKKCGVMMM